MKTRHIVEISALSSLLTVVAIVALLLGSGAAIAQNPDPAAPDDPAAPFVDGVVSDSGPAAATTPEEVAPAATTDYLHIAGTAFIAQIETDTRGYTSNGCVYMDGTNRRLNYSIALPYGSTITFIRLYFKDSDATYNATLLLGRYDDGISAATLAQVDTAGSAGTPSSSTISVNLPIDYVNYSYVFQWYQPIAGSTMQLCGFRIGYTKPGIFGVAMPVVGKNIP